jgi:hypothetical protein
VAAAVSAALVVSIAGAAVAASRTEIRQAYDAALAQFNNLDLDAALQTLDAAIAAAEGAGLGMDPTLAPLHVLRGGIVYSNTGERGATVAIFEQAVRIDYHVVLPIELRSEELKGMLSEARGRVGAGPTESVIHAPPTFTPDQDLEFVVLMGVPMLEGSHVALYWRPAGGGQFQSVAMDRFGNHASAVVPAGEHRNQDLEYFFYSFDANQQAVANKGDQDNPLVLRSPQGGGAAAGGGEDGEGDEGEGEEPSGEDKPVRTKAAGELPRVMINLGLGTGFGLASGTAENTYRQLNPLANPLSPTDQACQIARFSAQAQGIELASNPNEFATDIEYVRSLDGGAGSLLPAGITPFSYDPDTCSERHPVSSGFASSPFFIAPEIGVRAWKGLYFSLGSRLQVVNGTSLVDAAGDLEPVAAGQNTRLFPTFTGKEERAPLSWTINLKAKYYFGKRPKFKMYGGGFGGYGEARLRVDMGFANDKNGNSVPDTNEVGGTAPLDPVTGLPAQGCIDVWPYVGACADPAVFQVAEFNRANADTATRVDTVVLGQGFVGGLFGVHYQVVKNFALFAEAQVGGWFGSGGASVLIDINLGPAITF